MNRWMSLFLLVSWMGYASADENQAERRRLLSQPVFQNNQTAEAHAESGAIPPAFQDHQKQREVDGDAGALPGPSEETMPSSLADATEEAPPAPAIETEKPGSPIPPEDVVAQDTEEPRLPLGVFIGVLALFILILVWFFRRKKS